MGRFNRDRQISIAKGIGIILMVIGHSGCPGFLHQFIYMFHMPLFFICSGYFLTPKRNLEEFWRFVAKRIKGLYVPYLAFGLPILLLHNVFYSWHFYEDCYNLNDFLWHVAHMIFQMEKHEVFFGPAWFLKDLLLDSVTVCVVVSLFNRDRKKNRNVIICLCLIVLAFLARVWMWFVPYLEMDVSRWMMGCSLIVAGMIIREMHLNYESVKLLVICLIVTLLGAVLLPQGVEILTYDCVSAIPFFVVGVAGTLFCFCTASRIASSSSSKILFYAGEHSLIILTLHFLSFAIVSLLFVGISNYESDVLIEIPAITGVNNWLWIAYSIVGISVPLFIYYCYQHKLIIKRIRNCWE